MRTRRTQGLPQIRPRRIMLDFLIGLALFAGFTALIVGDQDNRAFGDLIGGEWTLDSIVIGAVAADVVTVSLTSAPHMDAAQAVKSLLPAPSAPESSFLTGISAPVGMAMLAAVFSALFAFNLAFVRHLTRRALCRHPALR